MMVSVCKKGVGGAGGMMVSVCKKGVVELVV